MSVVTGVTIISQCCDEHSIDALIQKLNDWIANDPPCAGGQLYRVDRFYGGNKHPECLVWGGGFNYLSWREFVEYAKSLPWRENITYPDETRVFLIVSPDQYPAEVHALVQKTEGK